MNVRYHNGVRYVAPWNPAPETFTRCNTCGRAWDDSKPSSLTPAPAGRCPFEHWHKAARSASPELVAAIQARVEVIRGHNYTEEEEERIGNALARALRMRRTQDRKGWQTEWGWKTGRGLFRMLRNVVLELDAGAVPPDIARELAQREGA